MKTGRVRKKEEAAPPKEKKEATPKTAASQAPPSRPRKATGTGRPGGGKIPPVLAILVGLFLLFVCVMVLFTILGGGADEWVEATSVRGEWITELTVLAPEVQVEARWQEECIDEPNGAVRAGSCTLRATDEYEETPVDEYEEYAYNIYYEETEDQVYEAQGLEFEPVTLGSDDWWEGDLHYTTQEELDRESCTWTEYTTWIDDPDDSSLEIEVYLAECEVWDHVVVTQREYKQANWCQCELTSLVEVDQQSLEGSGPEVRWPDLAVPQDGSSERAFSAQVTFQGDDYVYTTQTTDLEQYRDYMTGRYYIGLKDDKAVTVSQQPRD
ncbi:MAG: hypothetical protein PVF47_19570 [Anaerolineae bacterium]|jgi:hypothetical protein